MANTIYHVVALYTLIFIWIMTTKARLISDNSDNSIADPFPPRMKEKNIYFSSEELVPNLGFERPYRSLRKLMRPRATRVGDNLELFTARGYGKRSSGNGGCKGCRDLAFRELSLNSARRFGKRDPDKMENILCMITNCRDNKKNVQMNGEFSNVLTRRDKEIPDRNTLDEADD
ncbi:uncharacterized protein LOC115877173 [Sitophilus oryzae]|uniref:Uncharacterized protein LOC115877173 n=1 Tax=Sitophilus oryzae TaxID=7048 RepID=A0A6J2XCY9_SITOR|nr:uncharacterized protein LOC115877173 [Sitophilus oryzae]